MGCLHMVYVFILEFTGIYHTRTGSNIIIMTNVLRVMIFGWLAGAHISIVTSHSQLQNCFAMGIPTLAKHN